MLTAEILQSRPRTSTRTKRSNNNNDFVLSEYPLARFPMYNGPAKIGRNNAILKAGKMTLKEKVLFDQFHEMSFDGSAASECIRVKDSLPKYSNAITKYLRYLARNDYKKIEVNGNIGRKVMMEEIEEYGGYRKGFIGTLTTFKEALSLLYNIQVACERERGGTVQEIDGNFPYKSEIDSLISTLQAQDADIVRDANIDKHRVNFIQNQFTRENIEKMIIDRLNMTGSSKKSDKFEGVCSILELLLGHHLSLESDKKRKLVISDCYIETKDTSVNSEPSLRFGFPAKSKTDSVWATRYKHPVMCLIGAFAMSLWFRFDFEDGDLHGENMPDFTNKEDWYSIKMLFSVNNNSRQNVSLSYQRYLIADSLRCLPYYSDTMYSDKANEARREDAANVMLKQIQRAGNWSSSILKKHHLTGLPVELSRNASYFKPTEPTYISRSQIKPPNSLREKIFPWLEATARRHSEHLTELQIEAIDQARQEDRKTELITDYTANLFFSMLDQFRDIILQDLVHIKALAPDSMYAEHPITKSAEFLEFEELTKLTDPEKLKSTWKTPDQALEYLVPRLSNMLDRLEQPINEIQSTSETKFLAIQKDQETLNNLLKDSSEEIRTMCTAMKQMSHGRRKRKQPKAKVPPLENITHYPRSRMLSSGSATESKRKSKTKIKERVWSREISYSPEPIEGESEESTVNDDFPMNRNIQTVQGLVNEWYVGTATTMSIVDKNRKVKGWRSTPEIKSFYYRRKYIIDFINKVMNTPGSRYENADIHTVALRLDEYRIDKGLTLVKFNDWVRHQESVALSNIMKEQ